MTTSEGFKLSLALLIIRYRGLLHSFITVPTLEFHTCANMSIVDIIKFRIHSWSQVQAFHQNKTTLFSRLTHKPQDTSLGIIQGNPSLGIYNLRDIYLLFTHLLTHHKVCKDGSHWYTYITSHVLLCLLYLQDSKYW